MNGAWPILEKADVSEMILESYECGNPQEIKLWKGFTIHEPLCEQITDILVNVIAMK